MKISIQILVLSILINSKLWGQFVEGKIETDSSVIETKFFQYLNSIRVFNKIKGKDLTYYEEYFMDSKSLITSGIFKDGWCYGTWNVYNKLGQLTDIRNYDSGEWTVLDQTIYPNYNVQKFVLAKAFNFIEKNYGEEFTANHVKFNLNQSYKGTENTSNNWCEPLNESATIFSMSFDIEIEGIGNFDRMIKCEFDVKGQPLPIVYYKDVQGFQKIQDKNFRFITQEQAIQKLKNLDKLENDLKPTFTSLRWIYTEPHELSLYNGKFVYSLLFFQEESKEINGERSTITSRFNSFNFDFWTGEYIDKSKMKTVKGWGKESGFSTGLIPDK